MMTILIVSLAFPAINKSLIKKHNQLNEQLEDISWETFLQNHFSRKISTKELFDNC